MIFNSATMIIEKTQMVEGMASKVIKHGATQEN